MKSSQRRELADRLRRQHGVILRREARGLGLTYKQEQDRIATGELELYGSTLLRSTGAPRTQEQALMALCLATGPYAVASHQSATWLWGLTPPPQRHHVTVSRSDSAHLPRRFPGAKVHRLGDYPLVHVQRGIPVTNPLRALVDFAGMATEEDLDAAIDQALAIKLLTVDALVAELARLGRPGRAGTGKMRSALERRGYIGAPNPSVLESRVLRLLRQARIKPLAVEVRMGSDGRYRVDVLLAEGAIMEVDGQAYHANPEQKAEDERRRKRLRDEGNIVNVYTWRDVLYERRRVAAESRATIQAVRHRMADSAANARREA